MTLIRSFSTPMDVAWWSQKTTAAKLPTSECSAAEDGRRGKAPPASARSVNDVSA